MLSSPRQVHAARKAKAQARRGAPFSRVKIIISLDDELPDLPYPTRLRYTDEGFCMLQRVWMQTLNDMTGRRAPIRKRKRRVQKKINARNGALHFAPFTRT